MRQSGLEHFSKMAIIAWVKVSTRCAELTNLEISPHALVDDVLSVFQISQMFAGYLLLITDNVLNLLSQFILNIGVMDETKDHDAEGGGGRVEPGEEEENGGGHEADLKIFLGEEKILVILVQLLDEDIDDVIPLYPRGPSFT